MRHIDRRLFLGSVAGALSCLPLFDLKPHRRRSPSRKPALDIHVHLFGVGDSGSGCTLSKTIRRNIFVQCLFRRFKRRARGKTLDDAYVDVLVKRAQASGLSKSVLLAQDGVYDAGGVLDRARTHVYVPNDYVFSVASRYPKLFVPCPSINPDRRDSIAELERCASKGARILKIHPPIQGVDVAAKRHVKFFARCAALGVIVMVHTGHEHSSPIIDISLADPRRLKPALEEGCTVVACHCGTGSIVDRPDFLPHFLTMARSYERLYGDTSILGSPFRVRDVNRLLAARDVKPRLLHGSDYPFPPAPMAFVLRLGLRKAWELQREDNLLKRDYELKAALGFGRESAQRAYELVTGAGVSPRRQSV
jgi:predicted TIM-barrel fold metal-dependent hydrolase